MDGVERSQIIANNLRNVWRNGKLFVSLLPKNGKNMEATAFSPYQMKVIGLMEHVKSDEQMKEIGNLLSDYFAQKAVQEADKLWDDKVIDCSTIEKWKNEHLRTPY